MKSSPFDMLSIRRRIIKTLPRLARMSTKPSPDKAKILRVEPLAAQDAKWTKLEKITYQDPVGKTRLWECASRTTRPQGSEVDAVAIIAILEKDTGAEVILEKQFRPPTKGVCIEMPAGLVDPNESIEATALRELKEETGYIGVIVSKSMTIFSDPGFCNTNLNLVTVKIDLNDERNKNPIPQLEDGEFIEIFTVPLKDFDQQLIKLHNQGYNIDARVQNVAEGIKIAQKFIL